MEKKKNVSVKEEVSPFEAEKFQNYLKNLSALRLDGENEIIALKNEIRDIKLNKQVDKDTRNKIITNDNKLIAKAKEIKAANASKIKAIIVEACAEANKVGKEYYEKVSEVQNKRVVEAKNNYKLELNKENEEHIKRLQALNNTKATTKDEQDELKANMKAEKILYASRKNECLSRKNGTIDDAKTLKYDAYLEKYNYINSVRNNHHSVGETVDYKWKTYQYNFVFKDYFLRNALYFIIIIFFIACGIKSNGNLFSWNNIRAILGQSSTKLFYSLGVAGLILIAGTDLSIGRMTGMAASFACMILSSVAYTDNFDHVIYFGDMAIGGRVVLAILVCVLVCVFFSAIAGFFSAKFKMHPFITTLSTQLLMYGLMMIIFSNIPAFNMILDVKKAISGDNNLNLIIFAGLATAICWFIWNKTKFGKYMYAVGGNPEAASVSGISVFWVTMGIFIMAGVLYGFGGFFEAARVGAANPSTGFGTELDAIAACVVGGISFSGGVGKIRGAVIGTLIFTGMTYCLTNLGFDVNIQYIFKGIIIMAAVCLDSLKYLKRK